MNAALLLFVILGLPACATVRVSQFKNFAQAGIAYSQAADIVLRQAGEAAIDESSDTLLLARDHLTEDERKREITRKNRSDKEFLKVLGDIRNHQFLLRDYFVALAALAESHTPAEIGKSAGALYGSLTRLRPAIEGSSIAGKPVKELVEPVVTLTIARFQQMDLEKELRERGAAIERELALQQAAMKALGQGMQARLEALLHSKESTEVVLPYVDRGKPPKNELPKNWAKRRREILAAANSVESIAAAAEASGKLKMSFAKLVKNEFDLTDFELLLQDIKRVTAVFEAVKGGVQNR